MLDQILYIIYTRQDQIIYTLIVGMIFLMVYKGLLGKSVQKLLLDPTDITSKEMFVSLLIITILAIIYVKVIL